MSRTRLNRRHRGQGARVEILPLVDVLFLLLAVFLLSMTRMVRSYAIPVNLPQAATGVEDQLPAVLLLSVEENGAYSLAGERASLEAIRNLIAERAKDDSSLQILVQADAGAYYGPVMALIDVVREVGGGRVLLVADPKASSSGAVESAE